MKKITLTTLALALISLVIFYFFNGGEVTVTEETPAPIVKTQDKVNKEDEKVEVEVEALDVKAEEDFATAQFDQYLEKVESDWNKSIEELFLDKNSRSDRNLQEYLKLKDGYEAEREKRYEAFHQMMEQKYGPNYSYSPSADEEMFNEKLVKIYETNLAKIIGKEKMIEYLKVRDTFNQKLEDESEDSDSYILIEF